MTTNFLHGVEVIIDDSMVRPIRTVRSSVIGLIGVAPDADAEDFPLNKPVLVTSRREFAKIGASGTLPDALDGIYDQAGAVVVVIRVEQDAEAPTTRDNIVGGTDPVSGDYLGMQAFRAAKNEIGFSPKILIAPGFTSQRSSDGILMVPLTDGGTGYTAAPLVTVTDPTGKGCVARAMLGTTIGVDDDQVIAIVIDEPGEGYTSPSATIAAPDSGDAATVGTPTVGPVRNRIVSEMAQIAEALRAVIIVDGPNTVDEDAIQIADDFGSMRMYLHDPAYIVDGQVRPASPRIAGLINKVDNDKGFWNSPSNHEINGIEGTARMIDFALGDSTSRANLLNELQIATTIRHKGLKLWGNQTLSSDQNYLFLPVVRTADMVAESIMQSHLWAVDRCITATYILQVVEGVRNYLRSLQVRGAILGGDAWCDPDLNPANDIKLGNLKISYHFTPCYPAERVTFIAALTDEYIVNLFVN